VEELFDIQVDCRVWLDNLPRGAEGSKMLGDRAVLSILDAVLPPKGFGRDGAPNHPQKEPRSKRRG
jgi:hypothetical protein